MANPKDATKNTAPVNGTSAAAGGIDTSGWEKEQTGFDPYVSLEVGESVVGTLIGRDDRDPQFIRYQFMAVQPTDCTRGPNDDKDPNCERVTVQAGETFNFSLFHALEPVFNEYIAYSAETGVGVMVKITLTGNRKVQSDAKKTVNLWDARVPPATKAALMAWRMKRPGGTNPRMAAGTKAREQIQQ